MLGVQGRDTKHNHASLYSLDMLHMCRCCSRLRATVVEETERVPAPGLWWRSYGMRSNGGGHHWGAKVSYSLCA